MLVGHRRSLQSASVTLLCLLAVVLVPLVSPLRICEPNFYNNPRWDLTRYSLSLARADVAEFKIGTRIYYAGGRTSQTAVSDVIDVLDTSPSDGNFAQLPQRLTTARYNGAAVANETNGMGTVLVAGGMAETGGVSYASSAVDIVTTSSSGQVNVTASALSSNRTLVAGVNAGKYMLFAGGLSGSPGNYVAHGTVDVYNMETQTWAVSVTDVWPSRYNAVAVAIDENTVVIAGGGNLDGVHRDCSLFRLNSGNGTWSQFQIEDGDNGLLVGRFAPAAVTLGGIIMIAGGALSSGTTWSRRVDFFDPSRPVADPFRWVSREVLSVAHENIAGAVIGTQAVFGSGEGVDIYDIVTGTWFSAGPPPVSLSSTWRAVGIGTTQVVFAGWGFAESRMALYDIEGCDACPANSVSLSGSTSLSNCTCKEGYAGANGGTCSCCPVAEYKAGLGPGPCKACPAGSAGALDGLTPTVRCTSDPNLCCRGDLGETLQFLPIAEGNLAEFSDQCAVPVGATPPFESDPPALGGASSTGPLLRGMVGLVTAVVIAVVSCH